MENQEQAQAPQNLSLVLNVPEVNAVLAALSKAPYEQVAQLIEKIRSQAIPQLQEQPAEAPVVEEAAE